MGVGVHMWQIKGVGVHVWKTKGADVHIWQTGRKGAEMKPPERG